MRTPLGSYGFKCPDLFGFVERQSEFAFFGAVASVAALFNFWIVKTTRHAQNPPTNMQIIPSLYIMNALV